MIRLINGWTKAKVMKQVKKYNDGTRAINGRDGACAYQTGDGNRCAVGCFIPDNHSALESDLPADKLIERYPDLANVMPFRAYDLCSFQVAHDFTPNYYNVYDSIEEFLNTKVE